MQHPFPHSNRIIVVDDSAVERSRLVAIVRELGMEAVEVADSSQAVEAIGRTQPLLVLMDVVMPSPNGFELCRQLYRNEHLRHLPIIMCSVKSTEVDQAWARRLGVSGYLAKPYETRHARHLLSAHVKQIRNGAPRPPQATAHSQAEATPSHG